ncbi:MAG: long-chain-fatty-acid--CoA ligase [Candidatus Abyssobacteria bacterium SURF_17]|uniref:Long-chain-fatty-acid--CoA ligase n=1 Tax=Candidatus Abyssobacteria bacterium SURF_17 TaxID=2093361 RepID=A0A419ER48_9BACT|nr:MAG: long-chain-fatty-acid--CoA ligase [Candidatus Abyssubacteria bacterium SURF_17]
MSIARYLNQMVSQYPERYALIHGKERWTYADYNSIVNRFANALASVGIRSGDRIAVFHTNCPEHLFALFAAARLGAVYSPLNCRLKGAELSHVLTDCEPALVLVGKRYAEQVTPVTAQISATRATLIIDGLPGEPHSLHDFLLGADDSLPAVEVSDDAIALLMYTSGTTGAHKGVMHSHANIIQRCEGRKTAFDDPVLEKIGLLAVPMFHITGMQVVVKTAASGGTLVIMPQFKVDDFLRTVEQEKVMMAVVVPTMLEQIVEYPDLDKFNLDSLRILVYGGSAISPDLIRKAMRRLPCMFTQGYGLTEAGVTWLQPSDHTLEVEPGKRDRLTSVGRAVTGLEIAIIDEKGNRLPANEPGEIIIRGAGVMQGYWRREEDTTRSIREGWFYTGDVGFLDEDGFLFISGRKKDIIIRGGENIAPLEVENVLMSHPAVADAAVFGIPDSKWGEIVGAAVVLRPSGETTAEELIEFCRERIASYKKPERIYFVKQLPRNAAGKVVKTELKKMATPG